MPALFQYSFVVGCVVNNLFMILMESNLMGIKDKTGFKSKEELQVELVKGTIHIVYRKMTLE